MYSTCAAAAAARADELEVLRVATLSKETRLELLKSYLRVAKISVPLLSRVAKISPWTLKSILRGSNPAPARLVVKLGEIAERLDVVYQNAPGILEDEPAGNAAMGRGGRPDIWKSNPSRARKSLYLLPASGGSVIEGVNASEADPFLPHSPRFCFSAFSWVFA